MPTAFKIPTLNQGPLRARAGPADHSRLRRPGALPPPVHGRAGRQRRLVVCVPVHRALGRLPPGHDRLSHPHRRLHPGHGHLLQGAARRRPCPAPAAPEVYLEKPESLTAYSVRLCEPALCLCARGGPLIATQSAELDMSPSGRHRACPSPSICCCVPAAAPRARSRPGRAPPRPAGPALGRAPTLSGTVLWAALVLARRTRSPQSSSRRIVLHPGRS